MLNIDRMPFKIKVEIIILLQRIMAKMSHGIIALKKYYLDISLN